MSNRIIFVTLLSAALFSSSSSLSEVRSGQCHPCIVSAKVGPLIKEAQTMAQARDWNAATAKLNEAEAVKSNPDDETVINQLRQYVAVASSQPAQAPSITPQFPQP